jgi:hypothetical protein
MQDDAAKGAFAGERSLGRSVGKNRNAEILAICRIEVASGDERDTHGVEVSRADQATIGHRYLSRGNRTIRSSQTIDIHIFGHRHYAGDRRLIYAGQSTQPVEHLIDHPVPLQAPLIGSWIRRILASSITDAA